MKEILLKRDFFESRKALIQAKKHIDVCVNDGSCTPAEALEIYSLMNRLYDALQKSENEYYTRNHTENPLNNLFD